MIALAKRKKYIRKNFFLFIKINLFFIKRKYIKIFIPFLSLFFLNSTIILFVIHHYIKFTILLTKNSIKIQ